MIDSHIGHTPKVSVLIPTYNYGRFLGDAIESVLAQDFTDFELIISDDGSTDDSATIVREYAERDARIRAFVQPQNLGMVANWNWCLERARGEYVKFLFGDDLLLGRRALSQWVAALDRAPTATLVASARVVIDEQSEPIALWAHFRNDGVHAGHAVIARCMQEDRNLIGEPSAVLFRRHGSERGFDGMLRQVVDQEFWFHLLLRGDFVYLPEPLCAFRQHGCQQTCVNRAVHVGPMESLLVLERYLDGLPEQPPLGLSTAQRRWMLFRRLYYSRKNVPRSAAILGAEAIVCARLGPTWFWLMWCRHRVTKPGVNLHRWVRHRVMRRPIIDESLPPLDAVPWSPALGWPRQSAAPATTRGHFPPELDAALRNRAA